MVIADPDLCPISPQAETGSVSVTMAASLPVAAGCPVVTGETAVVPVVGEAAAVVAAFTGAVADSSVQSLSAEEILRGEAHVIRAERRRNLPLTKMLLF